MSQVHGKTSPWICLETSPYDKIGWMLCLFEETSENESAVVICGEVFLLVGFILEERGRSAVVIRVLHGAAFENDSDVD